LRKLEYEWYFLVAGLLLALLSVAHAVWGERRVFNVLTPTSTDAETYLSVYVPWHQLTGVLLLSGVALVLAAFQSALAVIPVFILALIAANLLVFFALVIGKRQTQIFARTLPQTVLFLLLIVLIILGIVS
jgi:hypothetical protein